jgi:hypothetical protein
MVQVLVTVEHSLELNYLHDVLKISAYWTDRLSVRIFQLVNCWMDFDEI